MHRDKLGLNHMTRDDFSLCSKYLGSNIMLTLHAERS